MNTRTCLCVLLHEPLLSLYELSLTHCSSLWDLFKSDLSSPAIFTHSGKNLLVYCKMFSLGISVAVNICCSCVFIRVMQKCTWLTCVCVCVCVCDRTRGMHVRGELSSVVRIRTIVTETCILLFLHSWHQVRHTHTLVYTCSHRFSHTEILPHFKAWVAFRMDSFRPCWVVMGSDSLNCYKPQCGAGVKWHMLLQGGGMRERERDREREVKQSLQPWLVLSPSNEKDSLSPGPAWVSCLGTDVRYLSICYSATHQHTHTFFIPSLSLSLPVSVTQTHSYTIYAASHTPFWPSSKQW